MKELFIRESDDRKVRMTGPITLIIALLFLIIFAGCTPAVRTGVENTPAPPAATESLR